MSATSPHVSVIIPAYNEEKNIPRCLAALNHQTLSRNDYEVVVVDNNSTDKTIDISREYGARVLPYSASHRVGAVRNYGSQHAHGAILAFMDADSYPTDNWLEEIENEFTNRKNIVAVCGVGLSDNNASYLRILYGLYNKMLQFYGIFGIIFPWGFNIAIRRDAYEKIGGFSTTIRAFDDADIGIRLQKRFGRKKIIYSQKLKVFTSTRKQEDIKNFVLYMYPVTLNHLSVLFLHRVWASQLRNVR